MGFIASFITAAVSKLISLKWLVNSSLNSSLVIPLGSSLSCKLQKPGGVGVLTGLGVLLEGEVLEKDEFILGHVLALGRLVLTKLGRFMGLVLGCSDRLSVLA